jgi:anti-sigma B factor antagonist
MGDQPPYDPLPGPHNITGVDSGNYVIRVNHVVARGSWACLGRLIRDTLGRSPRVVVLDLSGFQSIDPRGVDALISAAEQAGESDVAFCLVGAQEGPVGAAVAAAGATELFEMFNTVSDALASVS